LATTTFASAKTKFDLKQWLPILGEHLQIVEFAKPADFAPFTGKAWGVLADESKRVLYPFAGNTIFFEETDEAHEVFDRFRHELTSMPSLQTIGSLIGTTEAVHICHGKDGLFSGDQVAEYDDYIMNKPFWKALGNVVLSKWKESWPNGKKVFLDLGCGTGRCVEEAAAAGHRVIGLDLSYQMLRAIESKDLIDRENYLLVLTSAVRLPLVASSMDAVTSFGTLHHVSSPAIALAEVSRVLKPNGIFQALETNDSPFRKLFDFAMKVIPLWEEEAGEHQIISAKKIEEWTPNLPMSWNFEYAIYFLPHMLYMLKSAETAKAIINFANFPSRIPFIRKAGGILLVEGRRKA